MSYNEDLYKTMNNAGFEFLDFIGYFIPGAAFILGLLLNVFLYIQSTTSNGLNATNINANLAAFPFGEFWLLITVFVVVFSYIIGRLFGSLRWQLVNAISRRRHGTGIETYLYYTPDASQTRRDNAIEQAELEYLKARNKCMTMQPLYYSMIYRWYGLAASMASSAISCILLWIISTFQFYILLTRKGDLLLSLYWMISLTVVTALLTYIMLYKSIPSHFNFMRYIEYSKDLESES